MHSVTFSREQTHDTLYDTDFDHIYPSELPLPHSQLLRTYTNASCPAKLEQQSSSLASIESKPTQSTKLRHTQSRRSTRDPNLVTWDGQTTQRIHTTGPSTADGPQPSSSQVRFHRADGIHNGGTRARHHRKRLRRPVRHREVPSHVNFPPGIRDRSFVWGPMSEVFGRVRVMQCANLIFLLFNTLCGFAKTKQQMMAFRFLSGIGGSAPQAIGGGILSDCFRAGERGTATAIYSLMPFLSPAVAPIMGGYLTQYTTWSGLLGDFHLRCCRAGCVLVSPQGDFCSCYLG